MKNIKKACIQNVNQFAHQIGISVPRLKINKSSIINSYFTPPNTITIDTGLTKVLAPNELKFCLAHEIGHALMYQRLSNQQKLRLHNSFSKEYHSVTKYQLKKFKKNTFLFALLGLILPLIVIILVWSSLPSSLIILLIMLMIMAITPFVYKKMVKNIFNSSPVVAQKLLTSTQLDWFFKSEFKADQIGVKLTNPKIAIHTLNHFRKIIKACRLVQNKGLKSRTLLKLHPSCQKRINKIKKDI